MRYREQNERWGASLRVDVPMPSSAGGTSWWRHLPQPRPAPVAGRTTERPAVPSAHLSAHPPQGVPPRARRPAASRQYPKAGYRCVRPPAAPSAAGFRRTGTQWSTPGTSSPRPSRCRRPGAASRRRPPTAAPRRPPPPRSVMAPPWRPNETTLSLVSTPPYPSSVATRYRLASTCSPTIPATRSPSACRTAAAPRRRRGPRRCHPAAGGRCRAPAPPPPARRRRDADGPAAPPSAARGRAA